MNQINKIILNNQNNKYLLNSIVRNNTSFYNSGIYNINKYSLTCINENNVINKKNNQLRLYCTNKTTNQQTTNNNNNNIDNNNDNSNINQKPHEPTSYDKMFKDFKEETSELEQQLREQLQQMKEVREQSKKKGSYITYMMKRHSDLAWVILGVSTFALMFYSFMKSKKHKWNVNQVEVHQKSTEDDINSLTTQLNRLSSMSDTEKSQLVQTIIKNTTTESSNQQPQQQNLTNELTEILKSSN